MEDYTALILACESGDKELVKLYLEQGADPDLRSASFTLLMLAAQKGHDKVAEILLNYGANIEAKADRRNFQDTPLLIACRTNHYKVVELLLNYGANIEYQDDIDKTPMCYAAINGNVKIIKLLLGHGAEINADIHDYTPLMLAIWQKSVAAVDFLLDIGSYIDAENPDGETALHVAINHVANLEIWKLLLDRGANIEHRCKSGLTPLLKIAKDCNNYSLVLLEFAKMLLDRGADMNAIVPSTGDNALTLAAANSSFDDGYHFIWFILNNGMQVEWRNNKGQSALWLAAKYDNSFSVKLLHRAGADFLSKDHRGLSCLSIAFKKGHIRLVEWLLLHMKCDKVNGLSCETRCHLLKQDLFIS